ncbi:MAG: response regulator transcription factor [Coriobacteriia bacterium]
MSIYGLSFGVMLTLGTPIVLSTSGIRDQLGYISVGVAGLLLAVFGNRLPRSAYSLALPLLGPILLVPSFLGGDTSLWAQSGVASGLYFYEILGWVVLTMVSLKPGMNATSVFAWGRLCACLSTVVGMLIGYALSATGNLSQGASGIFMVAAIFSCVIASVLLLNEHAAFDLLGDGAQGLESADAEKLGVWRSKCAEIVRVYELSSREAEILLLLAKGRSIPFIGEELFLAESTVKSHTKHIYRKLQVHSRQELLNLIEECGAGAPKDRYAAGAKPRLLR